LNQIEPEKVAHFVVAPWAGMNAIAAIEWRMYQVGILGILDDFVEVDDGVEPGLGADPLVHFISNLRFCGARS
jgi:hypothetical protein